MDDNDILMLARPVNLSPAQVNDFLALCDAFASQALSLMDDLRSRRWLDPEDMQVNVPKRAHGPAPSGDLRI